MFDPAALGRIAGKPQQFGSTGATTSACRQVFAGQRECRKRAVTIKEPLARRIQRRLEVLQCGSAAADPSARKAHGASPVRIRRVVFGVDRGRDAPTSPRSDRPARQRRGVRPWGRPASGAMSRRSARKARLDQVRRAGPSGDRRPRGPGRRCRSRTGWANGPADGPPAVDVELLEVPPPLGHLRNMGGPPRRSVPAEIHGSRGRR